MPFLEVTQYIKRGCSGICFKSHTFSSSQDLWICAVKMKQKMSLPGPSPIADMASLRDFRLKCDVYTNVQVLKALWQLTFGTERCDVWVSVTPVFSCPPSIEREPSKPPARAALQHSVYNMKFWTQIYAGRGIVCFG